MEKTEYMLLGCARFIGPLQQIKLDEAVINLNWLTQKYVLV
jgi:hypothetical protein